MITKLTFVNKAAEIGQATIVMFQKNRAASNRRTDVIWHCIRHCSYGWSHPIEFPNSVSISASDEFGNFSPKVQCDGNNLFEVRPRLMGRTIASGRSDLMSHQIAVTNRLPRGAVNIDIFRGSRVVARHAALPPAQTALFHLEPEIWIGIAGPCPAYDFVPRLGAVACATKLAIHNLASAQIVMTGGDTTHAPLRFELANINSG